MGDVKRKIAGPDTWLGHGPLATQFPGLFQCAQNQKAMVSDYLERIGDRMVWDPITWKGLEITWFTDLSPEEISQKPRSLDTSGCYLSLEKSIFQGME